jgi:hypothetical protein
MGRRTVDQFDAAVVFREFPYHVSRAVTAIIVHEQNLVDIGAIHAGQSRHQPGDIHLLVVTGHHDGHGAIKLGVLSEIWK